MKLYSRFADPLYSAFWGRLILIIGGVILGWALLCDTQSQLPSQADLNALFAHKWKAGILGVVIFVIGLVVSFIRDPNGFVETWRDIFSL